MWLQVAPSRVHLQQVAPGPRRRLLDLGQSVQVRLEVDGNGEVPSDVLQQRLARGASNGLLLVSSRFLPAARNIHVDLQKFLLVLSP